MKIVYASRTGNVESIVSQLPYESIKIETGSETMAEPYVLVTYTDGYGDIPYEVDTFLAHESANMKGVAVSGDTGYGEAYGMAGDKIAETYGVPLLIKIENSGTSDDITALKNAIDALD